MLIREGSQSMNKSKLYRSFLILSSRIQMFYTSANAESVCVVGWNSKKPPSFISIKLEGEIEHEGIKSAKLKYAVYLLHKD